MPSCMRVPPELGEATSGRRSAVARSIAEVIRSAAATPIDPARKSNSQATTATRRPNTVPSPVSTDSSKPGRGLGLGQFAPVLVVGGDVEGGAVPADERPLVQHGIAERNGADPAHAARLSGASIGWPHDRSYPRWQRDDPGDAAGGPPQRAELRARRLPAGGDRAGRRRRRPRDRPHRRRQRIQLGRRPDRRGRDGGEAARQGKGPQPRHRRGADPRHRRDQRTGDRSGRHPVDDLRPARRRARCVLPVPGREIWFGAGQLEHPPADVAGRCGPGHGAC